MTLCLLMVMTISSNKVLAEQAMHLFILSAYLADDELEEMIDGVETYIENDADPETIVRFINGETGIVLGSITVPDLGKYDSPRARSQSLRRPFNAIKKKLNLLEVPDGRTRPVGSLRIPEILEDLTDLDSSSRIIYVGNPIYSHPFEGSYDFLQNGYLAVPNRKNFGLSPIEHPFGVLGAPNLNGATVYFLHSASNEYLDSRSKAILREYYDDYFTALGSGGFQSITADKATLLSSLCEPVKRVKRVNTVDIVTTEGSCKVPVAPQRRPKISRVFLCDNSLSQTPVMKQIGNELRAQKKSPWIRYALVLFTNPTVSNGKAAYLYRETSDPQEMADAFEAAPRGGGGMDTPGALSEGLKITSDLLRDRNALGVSVQIFADVEPSEGMTLSDKQRYPALITELLRASHSVQFFPSDTSTPTGWIPAGVSVETL